MQKLALEEKSYFCYGQEREYQIIFNITRGF